MTPYCPGLTSRDFFLCASLSPCSRPCCCPAGAAAQIPPSQSELRIYAGLHAAAAKGDAAEIERLIAAGQSPNAQDAHSRTPLHVAAHFGHQAAAQALLKGGANPNALDAQKYDIVTIAAVTNDVPMLKLALAGGTRPEGDHQPVQRHGADRGRASRPCRGGARADRGRRAARSRQQSRLDRADGVDRARQWRQAAHRYARGAGEGRREPEYRGPPGRDAARPRAGRAAMPRWCGSWRRRARAEYPGSSTREGDRYSPRAALAVDRRTSSIGRDTPARREQHAGAGDQDTAGHAIRDQLRAADRHAQARGAQHPDRIADHGDDPEGRGEQPELRLPSPRRR